MSSTASILQLSISIIAAGIKHLPSQACDYFLNKQLNSVKDAPTTKALKTHLSRF
ncbi:hypothetical protein J6590_095400 [Homalodisca vitripennis]|nr:hypothetical protein J6590_095400 [Homalodisca vitripennis]